MATLCPRLRGKARARATARIRARARPADSVRIAHTIIPPIIRSPTGAPLACAGGGICMFRVRMRAKGPRGACTGGMVSWREAEGYRDRDG